MWNQIKDSFILPLSFSLGLGILIDLGIWLYTNLLSKTPSIVTQYQMWDNFFIISFSTFLATWPLYYLVARLLKSKENIDSVHKITKKIESGLNQPIFKITYAIDNHIFKKNRHSLYLEQLKKISGITDKSFSKQLILLLQKWEGKITNNETELWRIIYERLLKDFNSSEDKNIYYISLENYLGLLLNILELCFRIKGEFVYHSYTHALPKSWFERFSDRHLNNYMDSFSKLLEVYGTGNILKRYVLTYDINSDKKNHIYSLKSFNDKWNVLPCESKEMYLNKFILSGHGYSIVFHEGVEIVRGFTELIYLGYTLNGEVNWKWVFSSEYIEGRNIVKFSFYPVNDDIEIVKVKGEILEPKTGGVHHKVNISLKNFPSYVENCPYKINDKDIIKCNKLENSDL